MTNPDNSIEAADEYRRKFEEWKNKKSWPLLRNGECKMDMSIAYEAAGRRP